MRRDSVRGLRHPTVRDWARRRDPGIRSTVRLCDPCAAALERRERDGAARAARETARSMEQTNEERHG
jgi:hypothetical protein